MSKKFVSQKGFMGPIGDDLPSLIPIVVALLLFFTIFSLTLNTYNTKNSDIRKQMDMTSVARELKGDSLILGINQFNSRCDSIKLKKFPYNFVAGIYSSESDLKSILADFVSMSQDESISDSDSTDLLKSEDQGFFCNYVKIGSNPFTGKERSYLLRYYPVAVQYTLSIGNSNQYVILPAVMAMVVWE
jgi:hypothetical protein